METKTDTPQEQRNGKKYEIDMCNGPILGKILLFALPLMCSSILQLLFNAADVIVVGRFAGDNSLAAVGSNTSLINLLTNFFLGLSVGANVLVARFFGAKQQKDLTETVHTAMLLSIYSGIALTVIGCIGAKQILIWMQTPEDVLPLAVLYLRIYFLGMTATMLYNFGSAIMRAVGDTRRPLYYLSIAGVINVLLNLFFVITLQMDVAGVAAATVISQCISAFLIVRCMVKQQGGVHLELSGLRIDGDKLKRIVQIGLPASFQGILFSFSNVIIQSSVNSFGAIVVAGNSAAANIEGFVYVSMNAFHQAAISFTGQNIGAAKYERVNKILYLSELCVIVVGTVFGNLAAFFGRPLLGMYTPNPVVVEAGMKRMNIICRLYALCGMMDVMVGSLRGIGYSIMPMIVSLIGACGLRLLWIFTLFRIESFHTTTSLYLTYPASWVITFVAHVICFIIVRRKLARRWGC
ncbi:MAG: MATE family efflux transporter [Blautia sp.]|nr:MATE family efflux transporter [Lachnoclostridium sp.]MCM1212321.1 MATE family efflux transporter [Blautia sp.]